MQRDMVYISGRVFHCTRSGTFVADITILLHVSICRNSPSLCLILRITKACAEFHSPSVGCFGLGFILDIKGLSQRRRAQLGLYTVVLLNMGVYIWSIVMQVRFDNHNPGAIDWDEPLYPSAFLPYFFVQTTGPLSQSYMYWLISSFATDAQCEFAFPLLLRLPRTVLTGRISQCSQWSRIQMR